MSLARAIEQLHEAETDLAEELRQVADRHAVEHGIHHTCRSLATQCTAHAAALRPFAERHGTKLSDPGPPGLWDSFMGAVRRTNAELLGRRPETGLLLLRDLRQLFLMACEAEIDWWIVRQGAMAARDVELSTLFEDCHEETWNQVKWLKTQIKEASAQILLG
jgi:hypothetical protein